MVTSAVVPLPRARDQTGRPGTEALRWSGFRVGDVVFCCAIGGVGWGPYSGKRSVFSFLEAGARSVSENLFATELIDRGGLGGDSRVKGSVLGFALTGRRELVPQVHCRLVCSVLLSHFCFVHARLQLHILFNGYFRENFSFKYSMVQPVVIFLDFQSS